MTTRFVSVKYFFITRCTSAAVTAWSRSTSVLTRRASPQQHDRVAERERLAVVRLALAQGVGDELVRRPSPARPSSPARPECVSSSASRALSAPRPASCRPPGSRRGRRGPRPRAGSRCAESLDRHLLLVDERLVEARRFTIREDRLGHAQRVGVGGLTTGGARYVMATAGSGTFGPRLVVTLLGRARGLLHGHARDRRTASACDLPKYLSTHASSCCCSKSPTTMSMALSGR